MGEIAEIQGKVYLRQKDDLERMVARLGDKVYALMWLETDINSRVLLVGNGYKKLILSNQRLELSKDYWANYEKSAVALKALLKTIPQKSIIQKEILAVFQDKVVNELSLFDLLEKKKLVPANGHEQLAVLCLYLRLGQHEKCLEYLKLLGDSKAISPGHKTYIIFLCYFRMGMKEEAVQVYVGLKDTSWMSRQMEKILDNELLE
jgi:hypothetical protein